jgi:hypothetical protein
VSYGKANITHQYILPGNYTVLLRVEDDDGEVAEFKLFLNVKKITVIEPHDSPEPEMNTEDNHSKDRNDSAVELMIIGISLLTIIIVIVLTILFISYLKKKKEDQNPSIPQPNEIEEKTGSDLIEPEIDWDDE